MQACLAFLSAAVEHVSSMLSTARMFHVTSLPCVTLKLSQLEASGGNRAVLGGMQPPSALDHSRPSCSLEYGGL